MSGRIKQNDVAGDLDIPAGCGRLHRALIECNQRTADRRQRELTCRHLNRSFAQCIISAACPDECDAVRSMCSSAGTSMKRAQCQQAKISLALCISSLQEE